MVLSSINVTEDVFAVNMMLETDMPLVVFDLETTGKSSNRDRILSFSAIKVIQQNGLPQIKDSLDMLINPGCKIPKEATEINGITDEDVKDAPSEQEAAQIIADFFGPRPLIAGYNSKNFDVKFINKMFQRVLKTAFKPYFHLDVLQMAKQQLDLNNYKLESVANELGVDGGLSFHTAADDVVATFRCFNILRMEYLNPDEEKDATKVTVLNARIWEGPNPKLRRVYIETNPFVEGKVFYDLYYRSWKAGEKIDLEDVKEQVLSMYHAEDEKELVKILQEQTD